MPIKESVKHMFPGYEIVQKIGQGGMGAVYKARQESMDRMVAMKILPKSLAKNPEYKERFFREARAAGRLNHPNIVTAIDAQEHAGFCYIVMEFVEGESVSARLKRGEAFKESEALGIIHQIANALAHAWDSDIIHRDVKPENFLYTSDGVAKLCDLGIAKAPADAGLTQAGTALGTPRYIAPEQARGKEIDFRADIYSLGASLYHMLTGKAPFEGPTAPSIMLKHINEPVTPVRQVNSKISRGAALICEKMLAKDPTKRYNSAEKLLDDILAVREGRNPPNATGDTKSVRRKPTRSTHTRAKRSTGEHGGTTKVKPLHIYGIAGGVGVLLLAIIGIALSGNNKNPDPTPDPIAQQPNDKPDKSKINKNIDEDLALDAYRKALGMERGGKINEAITAFGDVVQKWPNTQSGRDAKKRVDKLKLDRRIDQRREDAIKLLDQLRTQKDKTNRKEYIKRLRDFSAKWDGTPSADQARTEASDLDDQIANEQRNKEQRENEIKEFKKVLDNNDWKRLNEILDEAYNDPNKAKNLSDQIVESSRHAPRSDMRLKSLEILEKNDPTQADKAATAQLNDRNTNVRIAAIRHFEKNKAKEMRDKIQRIAEDDPSPRVRRIARRALANL